MCFPLLKYSLPGVRFTELAINSDVQKGRAGEKFIIIQESLDNICQLFIGLLFGKSLKTIN